MFCGDILSELSKSKVKYLIVGGVAVNLYGFARLTGDLDIMLSLEDANVEQFIKILKKLHFKPRLPVAIDDFSDSAKRIVWIREKKLKAFSVYNKNDPSEVVDILIDGCPDFDVAYRKRKVMKSGKLSLSVISLNDLITMKNKANRDRDRIDVSVLGQIKRMTYAGKKK